MADPPERKEEELPSYFATLGTCSPKPRQKYGGMFCNVEGAFENKTLDFESLGGGNGSHRAARLSGGPSESSSRSRSPPPALPPAARQPPPGPPSSGGAEELPNGCHQSFQRISRHGWSEVPTDIPQARIVSHSAILQGK